MKNNKMIKYELCVIEKVFGILMTKTSYFPYDYWLQALARVVVSRKTGIIQTWHL